MPDKYKYVSVCGRKKPIQTNSRQAFMMHVISCPTCQEKLPASIIKQLEPKLSELKAKRIKSTQPSGKLTPSTQKISAKEPQKGAKEGLIDEGEAKPLSPEEVAEIEQQAKRAQLDALIKDSPSFQGLAKSVAGTQGNVKELTERFDGFDKSISSQFTSLGETLMAKITGQAPVAEKGAGETGKKRPDAGETPGKVLSEDQEKLHEGGADLSEAGAGGRPSPLGKPDVIPAAMRPGYKAGQTPPPDETPPKETPSSEGEKPPAKEPAPSGGKRDDLPKLKGSEEIEYVEAWLAREKKKQGLGEEEKPKKKSVIPYISDIKDVIREGRELVQEFKGGKEAPSSEESKGKSFRDFADQLASKILERSVENLAGPPGQTIGMDQMNTIIRLLGTFFTGVRALPKPMAEEMIRRIMEAGAVPAIPTIPSSEGPLLGGGLTSEIVS